MRRVPGSPYESPNSPNHGPTPLAEKPYRFVSSFKPEPKRSGPAGHAVFAGGDGPVIAAVLHFTITTLTPLHVALGIMGIVRSQRGEEFAALPAMVLRHVDEGNREPVRLPILPGSSLKGAVRAMAEAISPSCVPVADPRVRALLGKHNRCNDVQALCPACRLFGSAGYAGHVSIGDIMFARGDLRRHKSPLLWKPGRDSAFASRYARQGRLQGRKFYVHRSPAEGDDVRVVIKSGASASGRIVYAGGRREELGLLVAALGADPDHPFPIKIGGGKPVGLGSVLINIDRVVILEHTSVEKFLRHTGRLGGVINSEQLEAGLDVAGESAAQWLREQIQLARRTGVLLDDPYQQLREILARDGLQKTAPSGPY